MNHFLQAFRKAFDFQGRSTRTEFWMFQLCNNLILLFLFVLLVYAIENTEYIGFYSESEILLNLLNHPLMVVIILYVLITIIPTISLTIRRLHDINRTGWFILLPAITMVLAPILNLLDILIPLDVSILILKLVDFVITIYLLFLFCMPSTEGPNQYGVNERMNTPPSDLY